MFARLPSVSCGMATQTRAQVCVWSVSDSRLPSRKLYKSPRPAVSRAAGLPVPPSVIPVIASISWELKSCFAGWDPCGALLLNYRRSLRADCAQETNSTAPAPLRFFESFYRILQISRLRTICYSAGLNAHCVKRH